MLLTNTVPGQPEKVLGVAESVNVGDEAVIVILALLMSKNI